jgi:hypothetical protein
VLDIERLQVCVQYFSSFLFTGARFLLAGLKTLSPYRSFLCRDAKTLSPVVRFLSPVARILCQYAKILGSDANFLRPDARTLGRDARILNVGGSFLNGGRKTQQKKRGSFLNPFVLLLFLWFGKLQSAYLLELWTCCSKERFNILFDL